MAATRGVLSCGVADGCERRRSPSLAARVHQAKEFVKQNCRNSVALAFPASHAVVGWTLV